MRQLPGLREGRKVSSPEQQISSTLIKDAYGFALSAHESAADSAIEIDHPVAVADLIAAAELSEEAVAAAFLHDVVEHTDHDLADLRRLFPAEVVELVATLSEDEGIDDYAARKAEHRARVLEAGGDAVTIFLADKLATIEKWVETRERIDKDRLDHYVATHLEFSDSDPDLPFLADIAAGLTTVGPAASD